VLGANDGLVSVFCLVMGVAGAGVGSREILLTGFAGLIAGALSMALGEWLSVQSSRELYQHQLDIERDELATAPEEEKAELALIYQAKGMSADTALQLAERLLADEATALDTLAREELSIDRPSWAALRGKLRLRPSCSSRLAPSFRCFPTSSGPARPASLSAQRSARWGCSSSAP
jgi:VIT1/CCC1 family predicted Fe2+/Mn2+ transporter